AAVDVSKRGAVLQRWIDNGELRKRERESVVPVESRGNTIVQCRGRALRGETCRRLDRTGRAVPLLPRGRVTDAVTSADYRVAVNTVREPQVWTECLKVIICHVGQSVSSRSIAVDGQGAKPPASSGVGQLGIEAADFRLQLTHRDKKIP